MKNKKLLLIFVKNPERGYVKTRLARTVGEEKAYQIYLKLVDYTLNMAAGIDAHKQIWYSSFIEEPDGFEGKPSDRSKWSDGSVDDREGLGSPHFDKKLQKGDDLGERMENAFKKGFENGFEKILIIGSDCPGITPQIVEEGFEQLNRYEAVIGPSEDGGYYLIGSKKMIPEIFHDIPWSTGDVFSETINVLRKKDLSYSLLPMLNDIDTEEDLQKSDFE